VTGQNFRVRRVLNAREGFSTATLDGVLSETRGPFSTCFDGTYSFKTLVPVLQFNAFPYAGTEIGTLIVNGARFSYEFTDGPAGPSYWVPRPDERPKKVTVDMPNGTTFELKSYALGASASEYVTCPAN
jgi:hypothetical protein